MDAPPPDLRTPVTLLTGWLGSGKTTLLQRLLAAPEGRRYAVLVNEFGEIGIDDRLVRRSDEEVVELQNGCVCCSIRGDLVRTLLRLRRRRRPWARRRRFDRVLIETTGLAEPAPLLRTFLVEEEVAAAYRLESVVTLVDAAHAELALAERAAVEQVALADLLLLNKADLVGPERVEELSVRLRSVNPIAPLRRTVHAEVPLEEVLAARRPEGEVAAPPAEHGHALDGIESVVLRSEHPLDEMKAQLWLGGVTNLLGPRLIRCKGFLYLAGRPYRGVLQGVYELYSVEAGEPWAEGEPRRNELVFLGRGLDRGFLERGLEAARAD